jgi:hypothetical protein
MVTWNKFKTENPQILGATLYEPWKAAGSISDGVIGIFY